MEEGNRKEGNGWKGGMVVEQVKWTGRYGMEWKEPQGGLMVQLAEPLQRVGTPPI